ECPRRTHTGPEARLPGPISRPKGGCAAVVSRQPLPPPGPARINYAFDPPGSRSSAGIGQSGAVVEAGRHKVSSPLAPNVVPLRNRFRRGLDAPWSNGPTAAIGGAAQWRLLPRPLAADRPPLWLERHCPDEGSADR